jgi:peptidoglycan/LPS O-acetylase OafA/YrhL
MNFIGPYSTNASNAINPISFSILGLIIIKIATMNLPMPTQIKSYIMRTDLSYGLYLYHMPTINFLLVMGWFSLAGKAALAICSSFLLAALSWYLIEKPALSFKR